MGLIKTSKKETNFVLPCKLVKSPSYVIRINRYYDDEKTLFKAYRQLKLINSSLIPLYPVVIEYNPFKYNFDGVCES